jgi:hypothetical protein
MRDNARKLHCPHPALLCARWLWGSQSKKIEKNENLVLDIARFII